MLANSGISSFVNDHVRHRRQERQHRGVEAEAQRPGGRQSLATLRRCLRVRAARRSNSSHPPRQSAAPPDVLCRLAAAERDRHAALALGGVAEELHAVQLSETAIAIEPQFVRRARRRSRVSFSDSSRASSALIRCVSISSCLSRCRVSRSARSRRSERLDAGR